MPRADAGVPNDKDTRPLFNAHPAINPADSPSVQDLSHSADIEQREDVRPRGSAARHPIFEIGVISAESVLEQTAAGELRQRSGMAAGVENVRGINRHLPSRCLKQKHISDRHWATLALLAFLFIVRFSVAEYHRSIISAEFPSHEPRSCKRWIPMPPPANP